MPDALSIPSGLARPADAYQEHAPPASLASHVECCSVAFDAGYYDQSHLIAEVKELTGLRPGAWVGARA